MLKVSVLVLSTLLLWLAVMDWPLPPTGYLDPSWQAALVDAHEKDRSFGNGIIFSAGPLGFLNSHFYLPNSLNTKLVWEVGGKLILAGLLVLCSSALAPLRRGIFLVAAILFSSYFPDTFFMLLIAMAVLQGLLPNHASRWHLISTLVLLGFLAQLKFTHCLLAAAGVGLASVDRLYQRNYRGVLFIGGGFAIAFVAFWLLAHQNPVRLWDYLRYSWQISSGYPWAMSVDEAWPVFTAGTSLLVFNSACLAHLGRIARRHDRSLIFVGLFLAAVWFLSWKHGFIRADGHVFGFFSLCLLLGIALPSILPPLARRQWLDLATPLALAGFWLAEPSALRSVLRNAEGRIKISGYYLSHPGNFKIHFAAAWDREHAKFTRPEWRELIGSATVDLINYEQGMLFLNELKYHPRPIPQSYSVYTGPLLQKNAGHFRRGRAPEFLVVHLGTIDGRFPTQDDSIVLAELPLRYDLVLDEDEYLLFRRKPDAPTAAGGRSLIAQQGAALGQEITLPPPGDHPLWLQVHSPLSQLGHLRSFLYKPPRLMMIATDNTGQETRYRIIPSIATTGFLIHPLIQTARDYADFVRGRGTKFLRSIRFEAAVPDEAEFWTGISVQFSLLPELHMKTDPTEIAVEFKVTNLQPSIIKSEMAVEYFAVQQRQALMVHAPSEIIFQPTSETRRLNGTFGLREGAYTGDGRTDGAEFTIEFELTDGTRTVGWRRVLDPLNRPEDQSTQSFSVEIPVGVTRLRLRTQPSTNSNWDWTYWTDLQFSP